MFKSVVKSVIMRKSRPPTTFESMPKKLIKRLMPDHHTIRNHPHLTRIFGRLLHDPGLWHLNRRSASGAFAVGLFCAFIPLPAQMIIAAALALLVRVNLPLSVALVWITNPITIPPMFYGTYQVGAWLLDTPEHHFEFQLELEWLLNETGLIWQPLLLGSLLVGTLAAALGYFTIRGLWRLHLLQYIKERRARRARRKRSE